MPCIKDAIYIYVKLKVVVLSYCLQVLHGREPPNRRSVALSTHTWAHFETTCGLWMVDGIQDSNMRHTHTCFRCTTLVCPTLPAIILIWICKIANILCWCPATSFSNARLFCLGLHFGKVHTLIITVVALFLPLMCYTFRTYVTECNVEVYFTYFGHHVFPSCEGNLHLCYKDTFHLCSNWHEGE